MEKRRPPDVSDSVQSETSARGTSGWITRRGPNTWSTCRRLRVIPPLNVPFSASARAPGSTGSFDACNAMPAALASTISPACPRRPNPVMSVAPFAPSSHATRDATRFNRSMLSTAPASTSALAASPFAAVVTTPVPSGFDRNSRSPGRKPPFTRIRSGWMRPVTQSPYFGSASTTV